MCFAFHAARRWLIGLLALAALQAGAQAQLVREDGRAGLLVNGQPYLILGAQAHNSSNHPAALGPFFAAARDMGANTAVIHVAWEQIEPREGRFDFSYVDALLQRARREDMRVVLLWFGTWKNTSPSYTPDWVKLDNQRFPRMQNREGQPIYCLSPHGQNTRQADARAFTALMQHLRKVDERQRTVIMVQVQNEVGTYGQVRDFSPTAQAAFEQPVPAAVIARQPPANGRTAGSWRDVYGEYADEYFHAWSIASYIETIAKAGRAVYDLPMYVNNALRDPLTPVRPWNQDFAAGGPTHDVIGIYQAAAPSIDIVAPDIYMPEAPRVRAVLKQFARLGNPLWVPEIGNAALYARHLYAVLGAGALGVAPFGIDYAPYTNYPLGSPHTDQRMVEPFARVYAAFRRVAPQWAQWARQGLTHGLTEGEDHAEQTLPMRGWKARAIFGEWQFGERKSHPPGSLKPPHADQAVGGLAIAQTGADEFFLIGQHVRVHLDSTEPRGIGTLIVSVQEGHFDASGRWVVERNWNGDQTDYGLNLPAEPVVLKVRMGHYR